MTDYYFGHRFYELQFNWHYLAYGLFALFTWRDLHPRGVELARYLLVTAGLTLVFSTFDEAFQLAVNHRVFDTSDIAKDLWGSFVGMTVLLVGGEHPELAHGRWRQVVAPARLHRSVPAVWLFLLASASSFVCVSSLLSDPRHTGTVALLTLGAALATLAALSACRFRRARQALGLLTLASGLGLLGSWAIHRGEGVVFHRYGLTVCDGIPIPLFDVMLPPDGGFRPVDKKHYFNGRDRSFLLSRFEPDILLIGAGYAGKGGAGFPHRRGSGFVFNPFTVRGTQVVILESSEACDYYETLKAQGKHVLFVLHTTG